jgi:integrase
MTTATINNKYLSNARALFEWAAKNGRTRDEANPAAKLSVPVRETDKGDRLPFSIPDLQKLFDAPLFAGCQSEKRVHAPGKTKVRDHRFWAPLLALVSGLRLNEIGQLNVEDVHAHNGLLHLHVATTLDKEDREKSGNGEQSANQSGPTRGRHGNRKKIKTTNARRLVPIHEELIKMGFLDLVQDCIDQGHKRLFPKWRKSKDGYYSSGYSRFFNQQLLPPLKLKTPELVFHSLRHNFKDALRNAAIAPETQNRAIGHKTGHVGEGYGSGQLVERESLELLCIRYKGLDLSPLHSEQPRIKLEVTS